MSVTPGGGAYRPLRCRTSGRLTPAAAMRISTSPAAGCGTARVTARSTCGGPGSAISMAVMVAAVMAPMLLSRRAQRQPWRRRGGLAWGVARRPATAPAAVLHALTQCGAFLRRHLLPALAQTVTRPMAAAVPAQAADQDACQHQQ